ncbi:endothelin-converting enzyme homolog [Asterias amurensis]|uniref:endothelin-converting enzyme homolog n=1 Tax=Asterias amurensis TaxID=7602 RepID=UPI003AB89316
MKMTGEGGEAGDGRATRRKPGDSACMILLKFIVIVGFVVFLVATIVLLFDRINTKGSSGYEDVICLSEQCVQSAAMLQTNMDKSAKPCDNFYDFACGGWGKKHVVTGDQTSFGQFAKLQEATSMKLKGLFERDPKPNEPASFKKVRDFYHGCMDTETIDNLGKAPMIEMLTSLGGWPVLETNPGGNWNQSSFSFERLLATLIGQYDTYPIISVFVETDDKNSSEYVLQMDLPGFDVPSLVSDKDTRQNRIKSLIPEQPQYDSGYRNLVGKGTAYSAARKAYLKYMVDTVVALGGNKTTAIEQMNETMEFEIELQKFRDTTDPDQNYNETTIEELGITYPEIDWELFFEHVMPETMTPPVTPSERIIDYAGGPTGYFTHVIRWLAAEDRFRSRVTANYMLWRLVEKMVSDLGNEFTDIVQEYKMATRGTTKELPRWKTCSWNTNAVLSFASGRMFIDEYFPETAKEKTKEMVHKLLDAFEVMLDSNEWMQEADKKEARAKADKMEIDIGFPEWMKDNAKMDAKYKDIKTTKENGFANLLSYYKWRSREDLQILRRPVDKNEWRKGPATINAFYIGSSNKMQFPAGILQPPFYHQDLPWYFNYGGIGTVIGHEITHGFDTEGRTYDKDGNVRTWWSEKSIDSFNNQTQCMVDQYSKFALLDTETHLDGERTLDENIADNGGVKEAYLAFKDSSPNEPLLPGVDYTQDQLFFISYAQIWCCIFTPKGALHSISRKSHSLEPFRPVGTLQNNEDFSKTFNCAAGSYMNPTEKCKVW